MRVLQHIFIYPVKQREQSVRDNILQELLPLQSVVRAGNNENSRVTDRMSDSIGHFFFSIIKELGLKEYILMSSQASSLVGHDQNNLPFCEFIIDTFNKLSGSAKRR